MTQQLFKEILKEMEEVFQLKNKEYAFGDDWSSNLTLVEKMGLDPWRGTVVRISDKVSRLLNLAKPGNPAPKEAIHDAFLDNAVYSVMGIMLLEGFHLEASQREKDRPRLQKSQRGRNQWSRRCPCGLNNLTQNRLYERRDGSGYTDPRAAEETLKERPI